MPAFPSGTRKFFKNATAPTGWVKDSNTYDHTLRVVTTSAFGSGGTASFSSMFSSAKDIGSVTTPGVAATASVSYSAMDIPAHTHSYIGSSGTPVNSPSSGYYYPAGPSSPPTITGWYGAPSARNSGSAGTSGGHTHTLSGTVAVSFGSATVDLSVKYVDSIICIKS
jgi:hypothetical protein